MKKILLAIAALFSFTVCFSQIKAPVQTDTLVIQSMQYHFDEIRPENWPFSYVVRTPSSFIFGDQEFKIDRSYNYGSYKEFRVKYGEFSSKTLEQRESENTISLDFDGYLLICYKSGYTPESKIDSKVIPTYAGKPNASLAGRSVDKAGLKRPAYNSQASGVVVVSIWVDQYGQVTKAVSGAEGTTIEDKELWAATRKAALETHFNMDGDAPVLQEGTITYYFGPIDDEEDQLSKLEEKPSFNGGDANEFANWVNEHLVYPEQAKEYGVQGRVMLQYTVDTDGKVTDVSVLRGVDPYLDKEAVRVVSRSPKWKPGKIDGKPVKVTYTFPVIFQLF